MDTRYSLQTESAESALQQCCKTTYHVSGERRPLRGCVCSRTCLSFSFFLWSTFEPQWGLNEVSHYHCIHSALKIFFSLNNTSVFSNGCHSEANVGSDLGSKVIDRQEAFCFIFVPPAMLFKIKTGYPDHFSSKAFSMRDLKGGSWSGVS